MGSASEERKQPQESSLTRWLRRKWLQFQVVTPIYVLEPWEATLYIIFLVVLFVALVYALPLMFHGILWWFPYPQLPVASAALGLQGGQMLILKYLVSGLCLSVVIYGTLHWM